MGAACKEIRGAQKLPRRRVRCPTADRLNTTHALLLGPKQGGVEGRVVERTAAGQSRTLTQIKRPTTHAADHGRSCTALEALMKILLAVDGSHVTKRMLSYIAAHDELLGPSHAYSVLTVVAALPAHAARFLDQGVLDGYHLEEAEKVLKPIRAFVEQQAWTTRLLHRAGHAAEVIAEMADSEHFDLIVMGTHGHSSLGNVVLGSVATGVLARCKTPVLLIR